MSMKVCLSVVATLGVLSVVGCAPDADEDLTGTETQPLEQTLPDGGTYLYCPDTKALVCHVPPGNPAAAHTICVGVPAVSAHLTHHPDYEGECGEEGDGTESPEPEPEPEPDPDAGTGEPGGSDGGGVIN